MQGSNNRFTADNENPVLNGSGREGKFRLKYATNFKPLGSTLWSSAHTHTPRGSPSFYTKRRKQSKIYLLLW